jgi:hypothetical protein
MSARRKALLADYQILRSGYLGTHQWCERAGCQNRSNQVHHQRGRTGTLMLNTQFWTAICDKCHRWIHDHPASARTEGLLGPWGREVRDKHPQS